MITLRLLFSGTSAIRQDQSRNLSHFSDLIALEVRRSWEVRHIMSQTKADVHAIFRGD